MCARSVRKATSIGSCPITARGPKSLRAYITHSTAKQLPKSLHADLPDVAVSAASQTSSRSKDSELDRYIQLSPLIPTLCAVRLSRITVRLILAPELIRAPWVPLFLPRRSPFSFVFFLVLLLRLLAVFSPLPCSSSLFLLPHVALLLPPQALVSTREARQSSL